MIKNLIFLCTKVFIEISDIVSYLLIMGRFWSSGKDFSIALMEFIGIIDQVFWLDSLIIAISYNFRLEGIPRAQYSLNCLTNTSMKYLSGLSTLPCLDDSGYAVMDDRERCLLGR